MSKSNKRNEKKILMIFILILILALILGLVLIKNRTKSNDIYFIEEELTLSQESVGIEKNANSDNLAFGVDISSLILTSAGQLQPSTKTENLSNLLNDIYAIPEFDIIFDESDDLFATATVNNEVYRKMFETNLNFDIRKPIIKGYQLSEITQEDLKMLASSKSESVGYVYFDYGYDNNPTYSKIVNTKTTLGGINFSETRYYETIYAIASILSDIPTSLLENTVFIIEGHTDYVSNHEFNQALSENRAFAIKKIMVNEFGLKENQIHTKGYSWDRLAVNTTESCAENRRVEIKVLFFEK